MKEKLETQKILFLDVETSTHNKGNPFNPRNKLISYVIISNGTTVFRYYTDPDFHTTILRDVAICNMVVGFNVKFDIHWLANLGISLPLNVKIWDCQIAEFINSGQTLPYDSLDDACDRYGLPRKPDRIKQYWEAGISTEDIPVKELEEYNIHDVESTKAIYELQQQLLSDKQKELVLLEGEDLKTLQAAEYAGIKVDVERGIKLIEDQRAKVKKINDKLLDYLPDGIDPEWFNFNSGDHLSALLYGGEISFPYITTTDAVYKSGPNKGQSYQKNSWHRQVITFPRRFKPLDDTELKKTKNDLNATTRFYQTDLPTLLQLQSRRKEDKELLSTLLEVSDESKVAEMAESLLNKLKEMNWQDDLIHGQFNQVVARTSRLSSSAPNLQNQPPEIDKLLVSRYS